MPFCLLLYSDTGEKYPKQTAMEEYASSLNLTYKQIRIWFVERRRKERKEKEVRGFSKSLLSGQHKCGPTRAGKKTNVNTLSDRSRSKTMTNSKYNRVMNQESDQSMDSGLYAGSGSCTQNKKQLISKDCKHSSSNQRNTRYNTSSGCHQPCNPRLALLQRKYCAVSNNNLHAVPQNHHVRAQVLFSKDYILKRVFRKDGPPLGVEFDSLPSTSFGSQTGTLYCFYFL